MTVRCSAAGAACATTATGGRRSACSPAASFIARAGHPPPRRGRPRGRGRGAGEQLQRSPPGPDMTSRAGQQGFPGSRTLAHATESLSRRKRCGAEGGKDCACRRPSRPLGMACSPERDACAVRRRRDRPRASRAAATSARGGRAERPRRRRRPRRARRAAGDGAGERALALDSPRGSSRTYWVGALMRIPSSIAGVCRRMDGRR